MNDVFHENDQQLWFFHQKDYNFYVLSKRFHLFYLFICFSHTTRSLLTLHVMRITNKLNCNPQPKKIFFESRLDDWPIHLSP